jgi:hypothetical protein
LLYKGLPPGYQPVVRFSNILTHDSSPVPEQVVNAMDRLDGKQDGKVDGAWVPGQSGNLDLVHPAGLERREQALLASRKDLRKQIASGTKYFLYSASQVDKFKTKDARLGRALDDIKLVRHWFNDTYAVK